MYSEVNLGNLPLVVQDFFSQHSFSLKNPLNQSSTFFKYLHICMTSILGRQSTYLLTYLVLNSQKSLGPFQYTFFNLKVGTYLLMYLVSWLGTYLLSFKTYPNYPTVYLKTKGEVILMSHSSAFLIRILLTFLKNSAVICFNCSR